MSCHFMSCCCLMSSHVSSCHVSLKRCNPLLGGFKENLIFYPRDRSRQSRQVIEPAKWRLLCSGNISGRSGHWLRTRFHRAEHQRRCALRGFFWENLSSVPWVHQPPIGSPPERSTPMLGHSQDVETWSRKPESGRPWCQRRSVQCLMSNVCKGGKFQCVTMPNV